MALFITLEPAERSRAQAARRRMRSPRRSTVRLIAAYACGPLARVRTEPEGTSATVTAQATLSHVPLRLSRRRYYSSAANMLCVLGKGREHFVLRIRSSLRVTGFVFADYIDPHRFHRFRRPGRFSTPPMFAGIKDTALSSVEARARPRSAWGFRTLKSVVAC